MKTVTPRRPTTISHLTVPRPRNFILTRTSRKLTVKIPNSNGRPPLITNRNIRALPHLAVPRFRNNVITNANGNTPVKTGYRHPRRAFITRRTRQLPITFGPPRLSHPLGNDNNGPLTVKTPNRHRPHRRIIIGRPSTNTHYHVPRPRYIVLTHTNGLNTVKTPSQAPGPTLIANRRPWAFTTLRVPRSRDPFINTTTTSRTNTVKTPICNVSRINITSRNTRANSHHRIPGLSNLVGTNTNGRPNEVTLTRNDIREQRPNRQRRPTPITQGTNETDLHFTVPRLRRTANTTHNRLTAVKAPSRPPRPIGMTHGGATTLSPVKVPRSGTLIVATTN